MKQSKVTPLFSSLVVLFSFFRRQPPSFISPFAMCRIRVYWLHINSHIPTSTLAYTTAVALSFSLRAPAGRPTDTQHPRPGPLRPPSFLLLLLLAACSYSFLVLSSSWRLCILSASFSPSRPSLHTIATPHRPPHDPGAKIPLIPKIIKFSIPASFVIRAVRLTFSLTV